MVTQPRWALGLDLGQAVDPTAIAIVEEQLPPAVMGPYFDNRGREAPMPRGPGPTIFNVRHLERLPLQTSYPAVIGHVGNLLTRDPLSGGHCGLVIDSTGVGRAVYDLFTRAGLKPIGVTITAGDTERREFVGGGESYHVAKMVLVSQLQALLHSGELKIAASLSEAGVLVQELADFRANISDAGFASFGARVGRHDDLVLALACACWWLTRPVNRVTSRPL